MVIDRQKNTGRLICELFLIGALSALVCFGQGSPSAQSTGNSPAQNPSEGQSTSPNSPNKVVLTVGNTKVTQEEMDYLINNLNPQGRQAVATQGRAPIGQQYTVMLLLSQKAADDHLDSSPNFQRQLALEKTQLLAQEEYASIQKNITVTPDEITTYYNAHKSDFEQVKVREIVVRSKPEDAKPADPGLTPADAKTRIESIQKALTAGTDPAQVTKQFGIPNVVIIEEQPNTVRRGQLLPELEKAAFELKDNQFSEPITVRQALVVLQVLQHIQPDSKDVSSDIETNLRQQKVDGVLHDLKTKTKIWMDPNYFKAPPGTSSGADQSPQGSLPSH